jgi:hypothetical protein
MRRGCFGGFHVLRVSLDGQSHVAALARFCGLLSRPPLIISHSPLAGYFLFWIRRLATSGFFGGKGSGFGLGFQLSEHIAHFESR